MKRVPEVFDTWYDSGAVPFASNHYPFENSKKNLLGFGMKPKKFPADFIAEGQDQTRGWFYSLLALNGPIFGVSPYKNVVVNGTVLAEDGQKMSKRLNNYPPLLETVGKFSADALRYFLMTSPAVKAEDVAFAVKGVDEVQKKVLMRLLNVVSFYEMYVSREASVTNAKWNGKKSKNVLDQWIIARLNQTNQIVSNSLEAYELDKASRPIADFVEDLSVWYLRRSRDRFKGDDEEDKQFALSTTQFVLQEFSKLIAPFMPFLAEDIYQRVKNNDARESVHLEEWPASAGASAGEAQLIDQMVEVRRVCSLALELRQKANIKVRQPLSVLKIKAEILSDLLELIKDEINVKKVLNDKSIQNEVDLDLVITPELKEEGIVRDIMRAIQDLRKEKNLKLGEEVSILIETSDEMKTLIEKNLAEISKLTSLKEIAFAQNDGESLKIDETEVKINVASHLSN